MEQNYADIKAWDALPLRTISWQQARAMLQQSNAEVLDAENAIRQADRETLSVYTDMIPGLSYYGYFTRSINGLSDTISADDIASRVNVTFSVPTLTRVPYRVYAGKAKAYASLKAKEGKVREMESRLYKATRLRDLALRSKELEAKQPDNPKPAALESPNDENHHWREMADILGNYDARWQILPESLPRLSWSEYRHKLHKLDPLVVCNFAMQLEQARLAQYGVALQYLPTLNTSLYSPSLFTSSGGTYEGSFLDGEDTRLNLSISYSLDSHLRTWNQYQNNKEQYESTKRKVTLAMIDHKNKVATLRKSMDEYHNWRRYMQKRMEFIRTSPVASAAEFVEREKALHAMQAELLNQEKAAVESEAAVALEYGLPSR